MNDLLTHVIVNKLLTLRFHLSLFEIFYMCVVSVCVLTTAGYTVLMLHVRIPRSTVHPAMQRMHLDM
jgi:hypothetical protein